MRKGGMLENFGFICFYIFLSVLSVSISGAMRKGGMLDNFYDQEREAGERKKEEEERVEAPLIDLTSPREEEEEDMLVSFTQ